MTNFVLHTESEIDKGNKIEASGSLLKSAASSFGRI